MRFYTFVGHNAATTNSIIGKYGIGVRCTEEECFRSAKEHEFLLLINASNIEEESSYMELSR